MEILWKSLEILGILGLRSSGALARSARPSGARQGSPVCSAAQSSAAQCSASASASSVGTTEVLGPIYFIGFRILRISALDLY